jgi:microcystin-dependent protein
MSRVQLHYSPYDQLVISGQTNVFPEAGPVGIGTTDPDQSAMLDVVGRIKDQTGYVSPVGTITMFAGPTAPEGWLLCDGSELPSGSEYDMLDEILNGAFGSDSRSKLPNLKGKVGVGLDSDEPAFDTLGNIGGKTAPTNKVHSHSHDHGPTASSGAHSHTFTHYTHNNGLHGESSGIDEVADEYTWINVGGNGGVHAHDLAPITSDPMPAAGSDDASAANQEYGNMPPYVTLNYIIKY